MIGVAGGDGKSSQALKSMWPYHSLNYTVAHTLALKFFHADI